MPLEESLRNSYLPKSIADLGIVKGFLTTSLRFVEAPQFESPIGPRIEKALRRYRFETGIDLTWKELGERVWTRLGRQNVDTSKISRIKNDQQEPSIAESGAFAFELDVSPLWLLWGIGDMGRFPQLEPPPDDVEEPVPLAPVVPATTYEEQSAARKKATPKRRARGGE